MTAILGFQLTKTENGAAIGAGLGLLAGLTLFRTPSKLEIIAVTALGGVAGAIIGQMQPAAAALTPASMNPLALVMAPGTFQETATVGQSVTMNLPQGGSWTSALGTPTSYGPTVTPDQLQNGTAISWIYAGPGTVTVTWTDASGTAQTTTLVFTNA